METRIHNDLALYGSMTLSVNETNFPENPAIGTLIIKGNCLYAYISVGGYTTWYPFAAKTNSYIHSQGIPGTTWTITHNLNTLNTWTQIKDADGNVIVAAIENVNPNVITVTFTTPIAGTAIVVAPTSIDVPEMKASVISAGNGFVVIDADGVRINGQNVVTSANVAAEVSATIGALNNLTTTAKTNIVAAINEVKSLVTSGGVGYAGSQGYTGSAGAAGAAGAAGSQGYTGSASTAGSIGYTGSTGYTGSQGYTGSAGVDGIIGTNGYAGSIGYTGSKGDTGLGFTIAKTYASVAALTADTAPASISAGQFALIETGNVDNVENSRLYLWNGTIYTYITDLSGAQGITGAKGDTGFTGSIGTVGYTGSAGSQGTIGFTGSIGAGYTGSASTVVGYTGSAGIAGSQGTVGFTGSAGIAGSQGTVGFTGSIGLIGYTGSASTVIGYTGSASTVIGFTGSASTVIGYTGSQGIQGNTGATLNTITTLLENATISPIAAAGTINIDLMVQSIVYYTVNASANFNLNFRGNATTTLNNYMTTGQSVTSVFLNTNGVTPYFNTGVTVDAAFVTIKWSGGMPDSGTASSVETYSMTIIKTGNATFSALASKSAYI